MSDKIGIIGAGWYGCHIASSLKAIGFEVDLYDRNEILLAEASGNNQFRLHQGFHYARHHGTRVQSRDGFLRFIERYPSLCANVARNIYAVPQRTSLIDFVTYKAIMGSSGIEYREMEAPDDLLHDIDGAMLTHERVILIEQARNYFSTILGDSLKLGVEVASVASEPGHALLNGKKYDWVIDATWGRFLPLPIEVYFEPTLLLYYDGPASFPAVTFVDGPLCSVYPTEDETVFTLSSVPHTPLGRSHSAEAARQQMNTVSADLIAAKRKLMEDQVSLNIPGFRDQMRFLGVQISMKTKPVGSFDDRSCYVFRKDRVMSVMSGKIDTIFFAVERILSAMQAVNGSAAEYVPSRLRENMNSGSGGGR